MKKNIPMDRKTMKIKAQILAIQKQFPMQELKFPLAKPLSLQVL